MAGEQRQGSASEGVGHRSRFRLGLIAVAFALLALAVAPALAFRGDLTQKPGAAGCIGPGGLLACAPGKALDVATDIEVSSDGTSAYVWSIDLGGNVGSNAVAVFDRDPVTGELTQKEGTDGCVSDDGTGGECAVGRAFQGVRDAAISSDGESVYVTAPGSAAVTVFDRDLATGVLTQKDGTAGCVSDTGADGCADGNGLRLPQAVAVSPDGESVYVTYSSGAGGVHTHGVATFDRDPETGELTQKGGAAGCVSDNGFGIPGTDGCATGRALYAPHGVVVSPDSESVYVASGSGVAIFDRDPATGALNQKGGAAGCVTEDGEDDAGNEGACADGRAMLGGTAVTVSADGKSAYLTSGLPGSIATFDRDSNGGLSQKPGKSGCVSAAGFGGQCVDGRAVELPFDVATSPDGASVYVADSETDSVTIFDRDPATGALAQGAGARGCVTRNVAPREGCALGRALYDVRGVAVGPEGESVYAVSAGIDAVVIFDRDTTAPPPPTCKGMLATVVGTAAGETLPGTSGADVIAALGGNDTVNAGEGNDVVCGGDGKDELDGKDGKDKVYGEADNDKLKGGPGGGDLCNGGPGNDKADKSCEKKKSL